MARAAAGVLGGRQRAGVALVQDGEGLNSPCLWLGCQGKQEAIEEREKGQ